MEPKVGSSDPQFWTTQAPPDGLPAQVGRYRLGSVIGRGGMGLVLHAHDTVFNRSLAVKVLLTEASDRADAERRFLEEAQIMGQLQHPGIPPVHDVGRLEDGRPFFAMKLIKGRTLDHMLKERKNATNGLPRFIVIFEQVCQAVAYAHSRGVLHRDLKPANVMVGAFGEVQLMDWGLAKVLGRQRSTVAPAAAEQSVISTGRGRDAGLETQAGAVLGTPAYMAPEQARGEIERLDERCDVFGLGAILCTILTGYPPFQGATANQVFRQAAQGDLGDAFQRLSTCAADNELVELAKRCLAPEAGNRPLEAAVVASAVAAHQAGVQERLRQVELERTRAQVVADEERTRRRLARRQILSHRSSFSS